VEKKVDYIFCINAGRSGSEYLKRLFDHVPGCLAFHEPKPFCNGTPMVRYLNGDPEPMRKLVRQKIETIITIKRDCRLYVETNHCFIKGFGWFIPQFIPEDRIGVIILSREKSKIIKSYLTLGDSPLQPTSRAWIISPDVRHPLLPPPKRLLSPKTTYLLFRFLKMPFRGERYYRKVFLSKPQTPRWMLNYESECLRWYIEETEARTKIFQERFKRIRYYEVDIEDLNSMDNVKKMLDYYGCSTEQSLVNAVGITTNVRTYEKHRANVVIED